MNEMLENSRGYNNFSGIADGMDGNVKFIFVSNRKSDNDWKAVTGRLLKAGKA